MNFPDLDWRVLDRLRATFLEGRFEGGAYWRDRRDLEHYDATFGERIGWKWDAVLSELSTLRGPGGGGWRPPRVRLVDWGCGSGVAGRRLLRAWGPGAFTGVVVHDRSRAATGYAAERIREQFPGLPVEEVSPAWLEQPPEPFVLGVSHVWNELPDTERDRLLALVRRAEAVVWVEPGTHAVARELQGVRAGLLDRFHVVAPCTHDGPCGLLAPGNERHWCHHFAPPPPEIFANSDWVRFAQRAGIDLRALPYSFLVLERRDGAPPPAPAEPREERVLGSPRIYKGYARVMSCGLDGVRELTLQKRDDPPLFKRWKDGEHERRYAWTVVGDRIQPDRPASPPDALDTPS